MNLQYTLIRVAFNANFSKEFQTALKKEISPSSISMNKRFGQYEISFVKESFKGSDFIEDLEKIDNLIKQGIHFIEL